MHIPQVYTSLNIYIPQEVNDTTTIIYSLLNFIFKEARFYDQNINFIIELFGLVISRHVFFAFGKSTATFAVFVRHQLKT